MSAPLRVLTVFQPWATLIMVGAKPFEFRSRRPPRTIVNQRVVIHAAARKIQTVEVIWIQKALQGRKANADECAETCLIADKALPVLEAALRGELPMGSGLGTAICGEGVNGYDVAERFGGAHVNDSDRDQHANWGWPLTDIEQWPEPIPARGSQGIWFWPTLEGAAL